MLLVIGWLLQRYKLLQANVHKKKMPLARKNLYIAAQHTKLRYACIVSVKGLIKL